MQYLISILSCSDYLFSFATAATKKISESVVETAQTIKKSVEEGNIDGVIDKVCTFSWTLNWISTIQELTLSTELY